MFKKKKEGFTLVELLIVLAVIAALLAIVTPVAVNAVRRAKATQVASTLRNIAAAAQQYYYTEEKIPTMDDLTGESTSANGKKYVTGDVSDYDIVSTASPNVFWVIYTGTAVDPEQVSAVWEEATNTGAPASATIGVKVEVSQYW